MSYRRVSCSTRIAIATTDGISVCDHLARSTAFLILEIQDGAITSGTFRSRSTDTCGNHASFVEMLAGANAVICGGIGEGAANAWPPTASSRWCSAGRTPSMRLSTGFWPEASASRTSASAQGFVEVALGIADQPGVLVAGRSVIGVLLI